MPALCGRLICAQTSAYGIRRASPRVCDVHPLIEGHLLVIPKGHLSCVGEFSDPLLAEFAAMYSDATAFIRKAYGTVSSFEHGVVGQTVFHSHVHVLPYRGDIASIVPEGKTHFRLFSDLHDLQREFRAHGKYLFCSIGDSRYLVDTALAVPRFFRDRFAAAVGNAQRGDWKKMRDTESLMSQGQAEIASLTGKWQADRG